MKRIVVSLSAAIIILSFSTVVLAANPAGTNPVKVTKQLILAEDEPAPPPDPAPAPEPPPTPEPEPK